MGLSLVALFCGAGLTGLLGLRSDHWLTRALAYAPVRFVGMVSYGLYVFHWFVVEGLAERWAAAGLPAGLANQLAFFAATLTISLLLAGASWYGYERHFLALKSRFAAGPRSEAEGQRRPPQDPAGVAGGRGG